MSTCRDESWLDKETADSASEASAIMAQTAATDLTRLSASLLITLHIPRRHNTNLLHSTYQACMAVVWACADPVKKAAQAPKCQPEPNQPLRHWGPISAVAPEAEVRMKKEPRHLRCTACTNHLKIVIAPHPWTSSYPYRTEPATHYRWCTASGGWGDSHSCRAPSSFGT